MFSFHLNLSLWASTHWTNVCCSTSKPKSLGILLKKKKRKKGCYVKNKSLPGFNILVLRLHFWFWCGSVHVPGQIFLLVWWALLNTLSKISKFSYWQLTRGILLEWQWLDSLPKKWFEMMRIWRVNICIFDKLSENWLLMHDKSWRYCLLARKITGDGQKPLRASICSQRFVIGLETSKNVFVLTVREKPVFCRTNLIYSSLSYVKQRNPI